MIINHLPTNRISLFLLLCLMGTVLTTGCGSKTYENRLNETVQYFAYLDTRNQALTGTWKSPGVELRLPLEFEEIQAVQAAPASESKETETSEPASGQAIDPRQPDYIDLVLPGMAGAWTTEVPVDVDNETVDHPAYLYVLSNFDLLKKKENEDAKNFHNEVRNRLTSTFDLFLNPEEFDTERFPRGKGYTNTKSYLVGTFEPEEQIDGIPYEIKIYLAEKGNNQAVILLVTPKNMLRKSSLQDHLDYSLETVELFSPESNSGGGGAPRPSTTF